MHRLAKTAVTNRRPRPRPQPERDEPRAIGRGGRGALDRGQRDGPQLPRCGLQNSTSDAPSQITRNDAPPRLLNLEVAELNLPVASYLSKESRLLCGGDAARTRACLLETKCAVCPRGNIAPA